MTPGERQARELGRHHGENAANYAANVSGKAVRDPETDMPLGMTDDEQMYYKDGWDSGVEAYGREES